MIMQKGIKPEDIIYLKSIIENYNVIISRKTFYDESVYFYVKRYEEIRKLTTGQGKGTTGCLLYYDYIKNHQRLIAVDLSRQKEC